MPKLTGPITFQTARAVGLKLQGAEDGKAYGSPALTVNGQMFACIPVNRPSVEPESLAVRVPFDQRDALLTEAPETYYLTDHYVDYPFVLVRLGRIRLEALEGLLQMAHQFAAVEKRQLRSTRRRSPRRH